ncbi:MAG: hypothetical protein NTV93_20215 [Verrucomicrobia bacterium]|nr:hypothetical protein [Verrucomicrobiota bacterium]
MNLPLFKSPLIAVSVTLGIFAPACLAQETLFDCIIKKNADWNDASSWQNGAIPSEENAMAIINGGHSGIVDQAFEAPISVQVSNGTSEPPDGTLTINADFRVKHLAVAVHTQTSGRVEQSAGVVSVTELSLASLIPEAIDATYDLNGGKLETDTLKAGMAGPGNLNMMGTGEVVTVRQKLVIGSQGALRFTGGNAGFPTVNASAADITIESGAALTVEAGGPGTKPGKFTLIKADKPLAASFKVDLVGFAAGNAKLLENEPGVVLEVK